MSNKNNKSADRPATKEDIKIIEDFIGQPINEFAKQFSEKGKIETFARNLSNQIKRNELLSQQLSANGSYQPVLSENLTTGINLKPNVATTEQLEYWLKSPQNHREELKSLSQYLSYAVGQYNNLINIANSAKAFNYVLLPSDTSIDEFVESDYMVEYKKVCNFLRKMNIKYQFSKTDLGVLYDGIMFMYLNEASDNITLLQLPSEYCYITSSWTYGFRYAFDLSYMDRLLGYSEIAIPELMEAYQTFIEARKAGISGDKLAPIQYYPMPVEKSWVFTYDILHCDQTPPFVSSMGSALDILSYKTLLKDKLVYELYKIIALKIPLNKDNQKMALNYEEASSIAAIIKSQLPENIKIYASPFDSESINTNQIDNLQSIVNLGTSGFSNSTGINEGLMGGSNIVQGTALKNVYNMNFHKFSKNAYLQYENFLNWQIAIRFRKYKFKVKMFGSTVNNVDETKNYADLVKSTNVGEEFLFASMGYEPYQSLATLQLNKKLGYKDLMLPITSAFNSKSSSTSASGTNGRATKSEGDLSDGGSNFKRLSMILK